MYRNDRIGQTHGGNIIYLRQDISALVTMNILDGSVEALMLKIKQMDMILFCIYRLGENKGGFSRIMDKIEEIEMAQNAGNYNNILGFGDYNFPNVKWEIGALPSRIDYHK
jgi:hypothetical protein